MKRPQPHTWKPDNTEAVRRLHARTGLNQEEAGRALGWSKKSAGRNMRFYLNGTRPCPFLVALGLWVLGEEAAGDRARVALGLWVLGEEAAGDRAR